MLYKELTQRLHNIMVSVDAKGSEFKCPLTRGISVYTLYFGPPGVIRPSGGSLHVAGLFSQTIGRGGHRGLVVGVFDCGPRGRRFQAALCQSTLTFPHDSMTG